MNDITKDEISTILEITLIDLKKPEMTPILRAKIMKQYMDNTKQTMNEASRTLGIPKTTIHTWLNYNKIGETKYEELIESGLSKTQIHNIVKTPNKLNHIERLNPYEYELEQILAKAKHIRYQTRKEEVNARMDALIKEIINELNRTIIRR